ncbi:LacI family transcriptional regulator [Actinoplanes lobatus]|uniref:DNA-binding LacI/PurR family transcriptional regulator n=1 Tax=Actinoplanes lobatus TaxID=113568 RepID=A0A7W7MK18_9ACTN|nr:substrate-binding domain-containing protein [Actinoplanes lobatus]MBB4753184.1 DNA-binding LacI/PurR family transcriptional regulator [Actinoplanes lobatus]GGN59042.1 LacI family transcriptional regulator [Actinoplanes lobatus]GIE42955.1 LacI family transcriptional regulator [Actinoplanes lobatus]
MSTSDKRGPLQVARRARLLEQLQRDGVLRVSDLTDALGASTVTIRRDIAQLASEGLVRRVHGGVALPTADDLRDPELDGPTGGSVGMLVPSLDYYWPHVARGAESAARELDLRIVLRGSSYQTEDDRPQLNRLVDQGVDALIVAPRMDVPTARLTIEWLAGTGLPVVLLERTAHAGPHHAFLESVVTDHAQGAGMAVRHLTGLGHEKVGVVLAQPSPTRPHVRRGWLEAADDCGLDVTGTVDMLVPDAQSPDCRAALDRVIDRCLETGTTALLVHADAEAIALVERCEERHLSVPGDLSVIAYDDEVAGLFSPALTAVRPPRGSIGVAAVRLAADRLADPRRPVHRVMISPSLQVRDSVATLRRPPAK